jgi:PqqD family protein of HPr-rel-A system
MPTFALTGPVRSVELDDGSAVFNPISWDTHLLNSAATAVLQFIEEAPRAEGEVVALLEELLDAGSRSEAARHAAAVLDELQRLGLVGSAAK